MGRGGDGAGGRGPSSVSYRLRNFMTTDRSHPSTREPDLRYGRTNTPSSACQLVPHC